VRDEKIGEGKFALEIAEEVDDLCADGDIEGGDGLVEDEKLGTEGEGTGDVDALALAAGELVGIAGQGGVVEADLAEEFLTAAAALGAGVLFVDDEGLGDDLLDAHAGIEGGVGILKDGLHAAAERAECALGDGGDGLAVEDHATGGGFEQAEDDAGNSAFAGAGFANEAEGLAALDGEGDAIDDRRGILRVGFGEVARFEQRHTCKLTGALSD
jgi:hypothetical protein